jgi:hypothetical protein
LPPQMASRPVNLERGWFHRWADCSGACTEQNRPSRTVHRRLVPLLDLGRYSNPRYFRRSIFFSTTRFILPFLSIR